MKHYKKLIYFWLILILLLTACSKTVDITPSNTPPVMSGPPVLSTPSLTPDPTLSPEPTTVTGTYPNTGPKASD